MISHGSFVMKTTIFLWVTVFWGSSYTFIEGRRMSREDYWEAKRLVKLSRRPSVKSIQAENGDIYDCVIIDKQLAFEHPALKNHTIQMKPTSIPEWVKDTEGSNRTRSYIGLKGEGCPVGSVPVRRLQLQDILRFNSVSSFGRKDIKGSEHHWAVTQSRGEFLGSSASVNLWNPTVYDDSQFSLSQLWIANEGGNLPIETVEAGWIVYPQLNGDRKTRLFVYWTSDGYENTGCHNLLCPGFVLVNNGVPIDTTFSETSTYDGTSYYVTITVFQDSETQNWWVFANTEQMGYWPKELFNRLANGAANRVDWGGEVYNTNPSGLQWPTMGSGHFPVRTNFYGKSCSTSRIQVLQPDLQWVNYGDTRPYATKPNCYKIIDARTQPEWDRVITYGGPGGTQC
ncbi:uncharacterized protein LOC122663176 [Telopea speciosissima]|uniref:uncharacterized protein LOC122663176 n=1 Tax=Telopea speciosissima TaxID=54955 RepID=UPI001CC60EC6|nr:uncharacterized protein LOC122663176 [Telopea speciosissima]